MILFSGCGLQDTPTEDNWASTIQRGSSERTRCCTIHTGMCKECLKSQMYSPSSVLK